jgi:drug/metabolite transporter (DMT)-like permease
MTRITYKNKFFMILPVAALLAAVCLWGVSFVGMRIVLQSLSPMSGMWCRMAAAMIVILPFAGKLKPRNYLPGDWKMLLPMTLFMPCLYFLLETNALLLSTSTQVGVISASLPVLTALGAWIFMKESIGKLALSGLCLSIGGVVLLTLSQGSGGNAPNPVLGNLMELMAMICAAANFLMVKKLSGRYSPWALTAMQIVAGFIFFLPGLFQLVGTEASVWTLELVLNLLFLGVFVSLGAFGLYNWGISRLNATMAASFINIVPVVAIITGWIVLGEALTGIQLAAAAGVIAGVMLSQQVAKPQFTERSARIKRY